jgi:hypothetical protein
MSAHDANVRAWARSLGMGDVLFRDIAIGEQFCFKLGEPMVKVSETQYRSADALKPRLFQTGKRSAVFRQAPSEE